MDRLFIASTKYTPEISFDAENNLLEIKGESYPENTAAFYSPVVFWLDEYLRYLQDQEVTLNLELVYFNSSTMKVLMDIFEKFEEAVEKNKRVAMNWIYDEQNENALEYGKELQEDLKVLVLNFIRKTE
ncbi:MAG: DUF1987 domain-containing protein [Proteobacteria bacterium]|nr:DUF1987 domain-containing protein [Pseudomonadota bacterium]